MTTTDEALTEQLWDAMAAEESLHVDVASIADLAAAILPIIRKAQADALRDAAGDWADHLNATEASYTCAQWWLNRRADEAEGEAP